MVDSLWSESINQTQTTPLEWLSVIRLSDMFCFRRRTCNSRSYGRRSIWCLRETTTSATSWRVGGKYCCLPWFCIKIPILRFLFLLRVHLKRLKSFTTVRKSAARELDLFMLQFVSKGKTHMMRLNTFRNFEVDVGRVRRICTVIYDVLWHFDKTL